MNEGKPPSYSILVDNLSASNVVVFDVETTGLDVKSDDIIQIAAVRLDAEGNHKEKFVRYLQASKSVGDSVEVHHITDEKLRQVGENPVTVLTQFLDFARDSVIVGHNVRYDLDILKNQLSRLGLSKLDFRVYYDTLWIYRKFYPERKSYSLEELSEEFNVSHKSSHDAFDDVSATAELLMRAIREKMVSLCYC